MDGGASWATVHEAAKSQTRLSDFTTHSFSYFKKPTFLAILINFISNLTTTDVTFHELGYISLGSPLDD